MPHTLAELPTELLDVVSSRLSSKDLLEGLLLVGNRLLSSKLWNGGITDLKVNPRELSGGRLSSRQVFIVQSLPLKSFNLASDDKRAQSLVMGLQPTLRRLQAPVKASIRTELDACPIPPFSYHDRATWIVSATYPHLEALRLTGQQHAAFEDPVSVVRFLGGLPPSLTILTLPPLAEFNFWHLIPPNITELNGVGCSYNFPSSPALPNLASVVALRTTNNAQRTALVPSCQATPLWKAVSDPSATSLPPALTSFHWENYSSSVLMAPLPQTLTDLKVTFKANHAYHPQALFSTLPRNLKRLSVQALAISWISDHNCDPVVLETLIELKLELRVQDITHEPKLYSYILDCSPNLEVLDLKNTHSRNWGLGAEPLMLLNARKLRRLNATLRNECFKRDQDGAYPLARLTALQSLVCYKQGELEFPEFSFEAFPPSLTYLDTEDNVFSIETLHLLPKRVTILRGAYSVPEKDIFNPMIVYPSTIVSGASSRACSPDSPLQEPHTFILSSDFTMRRIGAAEGEETKNAPVFLELLYNDNDVFVDHNESDISLLYDKITYLPPTLTHLDLQTSSEPPLHLITFRALPLLKCLKLMGKPLLDLSEFASLETLYLELVSGDFLQGRLPPNLTRLAANGFANITPLLPLPLSLTEINSNHGIGRESASLVLTPLVNLKTFQCNRPTRPGDEASIFAALPRSITHLDLDKETMATVMQLPQSLWQMLPELKSIMLRGAPHLDIVDRIYRSSPQDSWLEFSRPPAVELSPPSLAKRAGIAPKSILFDHGSIETWCTETLRKTYSRVKGLEIYALIQWRTRGMPSSRDESILWTQFAAYLSPKLIRLSVRPLKIPQNFASPLPRGLTELSIINSTLELNPSHNLPPLLTLLQAPTATIDSCNLGCLPRTLTELSLKEVLGLTDESRLDWPPELLELGLEVTNSRYFRAILISLPPSLVKLSILAGSLTPKDLPFVPSTLKFITMMTQGVSLADLAAVGLTLFQPTRSQMMNQDEDLLSPMLDRALAESKIGSQPLP